MEQRPGDETERLQCVFGSVVYAVTAANPHESSYACYYDEKLETYLGDVFSVNWMENVDSVRNLIPLCTSMQLFKMSNLIGRDSCRVLGETVSSCEERD